MNVVINWYLAICKKPYKPSCVADNTVPENVNLYLVSLCGNDVFGANSGNNIDKFWPDSADFSAVTPDATLVVDGQIAARNERGDGSLGTDIKQFGVEGRMRRMYAN